MKVIVRNSNPIPSPIEKRVHRCNVCGSERFWSDSHTHIERPAGMFEEYFIACSDECRLKSREPFIKWLSSKEGWSKKSATDNFDNCVLKERNE